MVLAGSCTGNAGQFGCAVMAVSNALDSDEAEVVVEVYINNYDEEYIKNWTFDDGTKVCDYNYVITYQPVPRSYALGQYFDFAAWITRTRGAYSGATG